MTAQYTLNIVSHFSCAHTLRGYSGPCQHMHGHNWKVEVEVIGHQLDNIGMVIDFKTIKSHTKALAKQLDHRYINDIPPFNDINPTAENMAQWFYTQLAQCINTDQVKINAVTLFETEFACARYTEIV